MIINKNIAKAAGRKTARVCDACVRRRARWYCTADDAFLCQVCDISVHSANQLASRHERVRLETSGLKKSRPDVYEPSWLHGFTKKARTRRRAQIDKSIPIEESDRNDFPLVPEIGIDENDENEEQVLFQVPVLNNFASEPGRVYEQGEIDDLERFLLPSDNEFAEFAEFAADMVSLLGEESNKDRHEEKCGKVKVEDDEEREIEIEAVLAAQFGPMLDVMRETTDWNFEYESVDEEKTACFLDQTIAGDNEMEENVNSKINLKLNYDGVIASWANQGSPWITGIRPELSVDDCWSDIMGACSTNLYRPNGHIGGPVGVCDGEREARVSRYREKRRTRLFSKKIRYQVRKLNAEKRPRMKGRFVKRTPFST